MASVDEEVQLLRVEAAVAITDLTLPTEFEFEESFPRTCTTTFRLLVPAPPVSSLKAVDVLSESFW